MINKIKNCTLKIFLLTISILIVAISDYFFGNFLFKELTDLILFLTFVAIIWYSFETSEMKKQIVEQNKLSICPILVMYYRKKDNNRRQLRIRNIGKHAALKIKFSGYKSENKGTTVEMVPKIEEPSLIIPNEERNVVIKELQIDGKSFGRQGWEYNPFSGLKGGDIVIINFKDIRGNKYESKVSLKNNSELIYFKEIKHEKQEINNNKNSKIWKKIKQKLNTRIFMA